MSAPIPIDFSMGAAPQGWQGLLPDLMTLIGESLSGQLDPTFLIGQVGGTMPTHDLGPWFDGTTWWFWNSTLGRYQPGQQGCAPGTIVMWGGRYGGRVNANFPSIGLPHNWLWCDGSDVSRYTYSTLFEAIGETWGTGDGVTTFTLPPGGVFYINAAGFVALSQVPPRSPPFKGLQQTGIQGVAAAGGGETAGLLLTSDMPPMEATLKATVQNFNNALPPSIPGTNIPSPQPQGFGSPAGVQNVSLSDGAGNLLGSNQKSFSVMPPFVTCTFIIKFQ